MFDWSGEFLQDRWTAERLGRPGVFVDVGAGDGVTRSNTIALERIGWTGFCVEPSGSFAELVRNRSCVCTDRYVGFRDGQMPWFENVADRTLSGDPRSMVDRFRPAAAGQARATAALDQVLEELEAPRRIDYLSLDTEGTEAIILREHDWTRFTFDSVTVEHNHQPRKRYAIREILERQGLRLVRSVGVDDFYATTACAARSFARHSSK
jgi:hypothetical protein